MPLRFRRRPRYQYYYRSFYRKPLPIAQRLIIFLLLMAMAALAVITLIFVQLRPMMFKLARTMVTDIVLIQANEVIQAEVLDGTFDYNKLVTLVKDNDGNISALVTNTAMINTLQTKISSGVFEKVDDLVYTDLKIPLGNAVGGMLFSGRGPEFTVRVLSIADIDTRFSNSFEDAGVNQTRHTIYMDNTIYVDILIPGYESQTVVVSNRVAVAETVIVGKVPNVYANIPSKYSVTGDTT